ncbi:MAG: Beta-glucanase/Beta-glucan synthetase [Acidimicrobiales bacterium]|nr:Beta-glucanase/Beta-glucan synthetase [Acidimicrobiales bacterium]
MATRTVRARRWPRALLVATVVSAITSVACEPLPPTLPPGWRLVGGDEFNGAGLNTARWKAYFNNYGDGGGSVMQCNDPANVQVSAGTLKITARRQTISCPGGGVRRFTTGFIGTRDVGRWFPRFAKFEMRARVPHGQGLWPAFWLRHRSGAGVAEVDIMEYIHTDRPGWSSGTVHLDGRFNLSKRYRHFESPYLRPSGWHTWGVQIDPAGRDIRFTFTLDGAAYHSYVDTQHHWASADPAHTWDMAVNMAVGGDWTGSPDGRLGYLERVHRCAQGGTPPDRCLAAGVQRARFPSTYEVDWIRVSTRT